MNEKGFTLIELLVVVAILGLLSSVVMTSIQDAKKRAASVQAEAQAYEFRNAIYLAADESGSVPASPADYYLSNVDLEEYLGDSGVPEVPEDISDLNEYYYITTGTRSQDALLADYFCVTEDYVIPGGSGDPGTWTGSTESLVIIAWWDDTFKVSDSERRRLVLPGSASAADFIPLTSFYQVAGGDNNAIHGSTISIYYLGPGDNQKELRWYDANSVEHPFACAVIE